jgi:hypothetical protein
MLKDCVTIRPILSDTLATCGRADLFGFHDAITWMNSGWLEDHYIVKFFKGDGFEATNKERSVIL